MVRNKNKRRMKTNLYLGKHRDNLKLSWSQAKKKYPRMKPHGDSDFDGTLNSKDCKPLNPAMDGKLTEWVRKKIQERRKQMAKVAKPYEKVRGVIKVLKKVVGPVKRTRRGYVLPAGIRTYTQTKKIKGKARQKAKAGPGRPAGVYKHISPLTGQKVPATTYYSHLKEARRRLRTQARQAQMKEQTIMARRGVPPQVTRMRQMQRIQQPQDSQQVQEYPQQIQQVQQYPQQIPIQQLPLQRQQQFRAVKEIMTGRRIIKSIPPRERWTM